MRFVHFLSVAGLLLTTTLSAAERPNLIVIMADDIGASELGCYGHPAHATPHLDALAARGVQFDTFFTSPVCHPTRFTLMTGQYGFRTGVLNFGGKRAGPRPGEDGPDNIMNHTTFAQLLKQAGYNTALAGKWQLSGRPPTLITETGFDEYCVWGYSNYYTDVDRQRAIDAGIDFRSRYWHPSICRNGSWVPTSENDYGPDIFAGFLVDFIASHQDQPFFVYYPMALTHGPWLPTPTSYRPGDDREKSNKSHFQANVEYLDQLVGRIVEALERNGLREETIILFTGDNGTGGDGKSTATEKGARVPLLVDGPPQYVRPRGVTPRLADMSDIFPTLMDFAGVEIPEKHIVDGHSLAPFLRGDQETTRDWVFAYQADFRILRTERWLLEENSPRQAGRLYDCGQHRNGVGYVDVTDSQAPEALQARMMFDRLLQDLPAPYLTTDGRPNDPIEETTPTTSKRVPKERRKDKEKE
jgi:arylsulfatase A